MSVTRAMLMAAGLGTRLKPFTDIEPKALMPLMGVPVAQFALDSLARAGVRKTIVNIHHHAEKSRAGFQAADSGSMALVLSDESAELLGSAGGLRKALPHFEGEPFFLVNADVLCDLDLSALARKHQELRARWGVAMTLAVFMEPPTNGKYREIFLEHSTGLVAGFSPDLRRGRPFFIGSAILEHEALKNVPLSGPSEFVPTILEPLIREKRVGFHLAKGIWKDIGSPELWLDAHLFMIQEMETGKLPRSWSDRIASLNRRIASGVWASRSAFDAHPWLLREHASRWAGPCYFSGENPPRDFGPSAVLYGGLESELSYGIGLGGKWAPVPQCV